MNKESKALPIHGSVNSRFSLQAFLWLATSDPFAAAAALASDFEQAMEDDNVEFVVSVDL